MRTLVDTEIVTAAKAGDTGALARLVAKSMPLVYNIVGRALNGHADVDDVVQETMVRVVQGLPTLRNPEKFRPWVVSITIRQIQERGRAHGTLTRTLPLDHAPDKPDPAADFVDVTIDRLGMSDERRGLVEASGWLTDDDRRLLALWSQELAGSLTRSELAGALALSPQHTAVRVRRLKVHLALAWTLTRAWQASPRCPDLSAAARAWDGNRDPRWFRRLSRHVRGCDRCLRFGYLPQPMEHVLRGAGILPLPIFLHHAPGLMGSAVPSAPGLASPLVNIVLEVPGSCGGWLRR